MLTYKYVGFFFFDDFYMLTTKDELGNTSEMIYLLACSQNKFRSL